MSQEVHTVDVTQLVTTINKLTERVGILIGKLDSMGDFSERLREVEGVCRDYKKWQSDRWKHMTLLVAGTGAISALIGAVVAVLTRMGGG